MQDSPARDHKEGLSCKDASRRKTGLLDRHGSPDGSGLSLISMNLAPCIVAKVPSVSALACSASAALTAKNCCLPQTKNRCYTGGRIISGVFFFWPAKIGGGEFWYCSLEMKENFGMRPLVVAS